MDEIFVGKGKHSLYLLPRLANRHGLIAGATGTGKTVTLQTLAQGFSRLGVPVFTVDVKGDLAGISRPGSSSNVKVLERLKELGIEDPKFAGCPVFFWDIFGKEGSPIRARLEDMGPLLLGRMLSLNEVQMGVLNLIFKIAQEEKLPLIDLKDLQALLKYIGDNARTFTTQYGYISTASIGGIQRSLSELQQQGGENLFGEPPLDLDSFFKVNPEGQGYVNILAAETLMQSPKMYAMFLFWLLSELYDKLPEVGDPDRPKLIFFFDEAHLLFTDAPKALLDKIELVVRLIRSKGVGVFFVTQNPIDIPNNVLGQLGNRVQHAIRAFTPRDQKAVKASAETFRSNPDLKVAEVITQLAVGEALVSLLDEKGIPSVVEKALICPPLSQVGAITPEQRKEIIQKSIVHSQYEKSVDRESAYEILKARAEEAAKNPPEDKRGRGSRSGPVSQIFKGAWAVINSRIVRDIVKSVLDSFKRR